MSRTFVGLIAWQGLLLAGMALTAFFVGMRWYGTEGTGLQHAVTMGFTTLALALQIVLHTVPLTATDVVVVAVCSLAPVAVVDVLKLVAPASASGR